MASLRWLFTLVTTLALSLPSPAQNGSINRKTAAAAAAPDSGQINNGVYRNRFFNFSYKLPFGWVDRTQDLREPDDQPKSALLLSIFEHPPEATATTINSAVVIAAEKL